MDAKNQIYIYLIYPCSEKQDVHSMVDIWRWVFALSHVSELFPWDLYAEKDRGSRLVMKIQVWVYHCWKDNFKQIAGEGLTKVLLSDAITPSAFLIILDMWFVQRRSMFTIILRSHPIEDVLRLVLLREYVKAGFSSQKARWRTYPQLASIASQGSIVVMYPDLIAEEIHSV